MFRKRAERPFLLLPAGYGLAGWATDRLGPSLVFVIGGAVTLGLAGLVLAHPSIRNLDCAAATVLQARRVRSSHN